MLNKFNSLLLASSLILLHKWDAPYLRLSDLQNHLLEKYQVFFALNQSYYSLFKAAKIS